MMDFATSWTLCLD